MKDAGKVTLLPRGEYNSSTQYEMLDMVTFNDKSYCAVKNTKGNTPSPTSSFWMYLGLGGATASFDAIALTQAEYDGLSTADKNNDMVYFITDADGYFGPGSGGGGDMYRSIYDTDNDGKVDKAKNADTVNNHTVLSNVPAGAKFTDTTYSVMTGATSSANGTSGLIPAPTIADRNKFFRGDGTYQEIDQSIIGFGTPTATINNATGTPSVTVTATGDNSAKVFNFAFMNLKGAKGDKGDTGSAGPQGAKGDKGDKGSVEWSAMSATEKQELIDAIVDLVESDIGSTDSLSF